MAANQELSDVRQLLVNAPRQATRDPDNITRFDLILIQQAQCTSAVHVLVHCTSTCTADESPQTNWQRYRLEDNQVFNKPGSGSMEGPK